MYSCLPPIFRTPPNDRFGIGAVTVSGCQNALDSAAAEMHVDVFIVVLRLVDVRDVLDAASLVAQKRQFQRGDKFTFFP